MVAKPELPTQLSPDTVLKRGYRILRMLGEGNMGRVYEAEHIEIGRRSALKQTFHDNEDERKWFRNEATLLSKLKHAGLPQFHEYFEECGSYFFAMELIDGPSLKETLDEKGALGPTEVLQLAEQVLDVLQYLHAKGIIHRDIKPDNIRIDGNNVFLVDFGLAKEMTTGTVVQAHTPNYSPPEQSQPGKTTNRQSDIYSFGATLYHLLTGDLPPKAFERKSEVDNGNPDPLRFAHEVNPAVSQALGDLVYKAMALEPRDRFETAENMLSAIADLKSGAEYLEKGKDYLAKQDYDNAIIAFGKAITTQAGYAEAYVERGKAHFYKEHYHKALEDLNIAIDLNPTLSPAYFWRAAVYGCEGNHGLSIENWNKSIELDPTYWATYHNRARQFEKNGDLESALDDYSRAIDLNPLDKASYADRARVHKLLAIKNIKKVLELCAAKAEKESYELCQRAKYQLNVLQARRRSRTFLVAFIVVLVAFLLSLRYQYYRTSSAEKRAEQAEATAQSLGRDKAVMENRAQQAELDLAIEKARREGRDVWLLARLENRTDKPITFRYSEFEGSWVSDNLQPGYRIFLWGTHILVKFRPVEGAKEKQSALAWKAVIGHRPEASDKTDSPIHFFFKSDNGEIDIQRQP
jgi:serine/threonine protein kinase